ncbi:DUF2059 domain-containing protein, partial [Pseudomonas aeruginosa]|uniref:nicotinate-nucleotide--dimethylbenzimidazole phosphoribosyltransferase n=1 Tax=Pseudomonas aeruginosa TaxID=287 RepID=UPI0020C8F244
MSLQWWRDTCREADPQMRRRAAERQDRLTKPRGSLGRLEQVAIDLAALQGRERPSLERLWVTVFAGDHGVVAEGVSAYPQLYTTNFTESELKDLNAFYQSPLGKK